MLTPIHYQSYLLRCWEEREPYLDQTGVWRFSLDNPQTGERHGFSSLEALTGFLQTQLVESQEQKEIR